MVKNPLGEADAVNGLNEVYGSDFPYAKGFMVSLLKSM